jgi:hypothetical protein
MREVEFPLICPECKKESLSRMPAAMIDRTLQNGETLLLRSACHGVQWPASTGETEQIRQYLWVAQFS